MGIAKTSGLDFAHLINHSDSSASTCWWLVPDTSISLSFCFQSLFLEAVL